MKDRSLAKALQRTLRYHLAAALGRTIRPVKLRLGVTDRCNSRCAMCSAWRKPPAAASEQAPEITLEELAAIHANSRRHLSRLTHISLTGGEPTLRADLGDIVATLTRLWPDCSLNINTNGFLTRRVETLARDALDARDQLSVFVSLDGMGPAHDAVRGVAGAFDKTMATLESLLALRGEARAAGKRLGLEINFVMTNLNAGQAAPVFEFCSRNRLGFNPIQATTGELYNNCAADVTLSDETRRIHAEQINEILRRAPSLPIFEISRQLHGAPRDFDCWAGLTMLLIEDDTTVYPNGGCPQDFALGRLRDCGYSFERLLRTAQARAVLTRVRRCRACQIPCETNSTLDGPEALAGWRKRRRLAKDSRA